ncbi:MAG: universal stress protein [Candidatus Nitrosopumilus sp. bin_68KS]
MTFTNILVPYDGSTNANRAFKKAAEIANQHNSTLEVVACLDIKNLGGWYIDKHLNKKIMKEAKKLLAKLFCQLKEIAKRKSIHINTVMLESNNTVKSLLSFAKSQNIDLIVMGSSGRGKFDKVLLGSVSNGMVQKAKCPVLIIK